MYRSILTVAPSFFCAFLFAMPLAGQATIGVRGGWTLAGADVQDLSGTFDEDNRTGWSVGVFMPLGQGAFTIQPEVSFIEKGFEGSDGSTNREVRLRYIEPAVLLKLGIPLVALKPSVFGGVALGFETECLINDAECGTGAFGFETGSTDWSALFGVDLGLFVGESFSVWADVRYSLGLNDIHQTSDIWTGIENRAWQAQLGIGFPLGGG